MKDFYIQNEETLIWSMMNKESTARHIDKLWWKCKTHTQKENLRGSK